MKRVKHPGVLYLILSFTILLIVSISFFAFVAVKNNKKQRFHGRINKDNSEFSLTLGISKSWVNDEGLASENYGEQFDFAFKSNKGAELSNWSATILFNDENFELIDIDSSWNVDSDSLKNTKQTIDISPEKGKSLAIETIQPDENNSFGFVLIVKNKMTEENLSNFTFELVGEFHRPVTSYPLFWILFISYIAFIIALLTYFIVRLKERNFEKFKKNSYDIISQSMNTFASLIDTKDPYTKDHSGRVSYYSVKIARKLGMDDDYVRNIAYIALMHDCGKLVIEDDILTKPARLTDEEFSIMKEHTTYGGKALENLTAIKDMKDGAMYHHERYDGSGYPKGLKGEEIPLCARIIGVADALDAMSSDRCYRKRLSKEKILSELKDCSGKQFDPKIAKLVVDMINNNELNIEDKKDAD